MTPPRATPKAFGCHVPPPPGEGRGSLTPKPAPSKIGPELLDEGVCHSCADSLRTHGPGFGHTSSDRPGVHCESGWEERVSRTFFLGLGWALRAGEYLRLPRSGFPWVVSAVLQGFWGGGTGPHSIGGVVHAGRRGCCVMCRS